MAGGPAFVAYVTALVTAGAPVDPGYLTDPTLGVTHVAAILQFLGQLMDSSSLPGVAFESTIAAVLSNYGLIDAPSWQLVAPAALGANAALGVVAMVASGLSTAPNLVAGASILNTCPTGTSLYDVPALQALLPGVPEFSCWNARLNPASFGTRCVHVPPSGSPKLLSQCAVRQAIAACSVAAPAAARTLCLAG